MPSASPRPLHRDKAGTCQPSIPKIHKASQRFERCAFSINGTNECQPTGNHVGDGFRGIYGAARPLDQTTLPLSTTLDPWIALPNRRRPAHCQHVREQQLALPHPTSGRTLFKKSGHTSPSRPIRSSWRFPSRCRRYRRPFGLGSPIMPRSIRESLQSQRLGALV
jgi:hypothetical protein